MDRAKIFKDYFVSSQNAVLIPNEDFGRRKFINVGLGRSVSLSRIEELTKNHIDMRSGNKQWIHPPDALTRGHIIYNVKFYGECNVDSPKGTDIVKEAIRKRKFNKTLRKTEGQKTPKVELSISIDGVKIQEPKTKFVKHEYPLYRISYCADDKSDKRMFTFIAKASDSNQHYCYVFASDKNAEEITLTIGQAFDLAYRRFLDSQSKDADLKKQQANLAKRVENLERENTQLKQRIRELEMLKDRADIENYKQSRQLSDLTRIPGGTTSGAVVNIHNTSGETSTDSPAQPKLTSVGRQLENLMFEPTQNSSVTNGNGHTPKTPGIISPPPPSTRSRANRAGSSTTPTSPLQQQQAPLPPTPNSADELASLFMSPNVEASQPVQQNHYNNNLINPFSSPASVGKDPTDPFGMATFSPTTSTNSANDFSDIQAGFSRGLSFDTTDFGMDEFWTDMNQS